MNVKRIGVVVSKEWREIVRDRLFFTLAFVVPALLMILFGYGLSLDVENIPIGIADYDRSALSREYAHRFIDARYFDFQGYADDERVLAEGVSTNRLRAYIVIPQHFERSLRNGQPAHVQTVIDGTFPMRASTTKGYVTAINTAFSLQLVANGLAATSGISPDSASALLSPVSLEVRYLYNEAVESIWSIAPKLIMALLLVTPPFLTVLGIVREKERGSIYNIYSSTVTRAEFLIGKILPYIGISMLNALILWCFATLLFGAPFKGSFLLFLVASLAYVTCTTGIGLVVSSLVNTQVAAMIVTLIVTLIPAVLYSGVIVPVSSLSGGASLVAHLLPAMYYADIMTGSFLKGLGFERYWEEILIFVAYAAALFAIGHFAFRKRPSR